MQCPFFIRKQIWLNLRSLLKGAWASFLRVPRYSLANNHSAIASYLSIIHVMRGLYNWPFWGYSVEEVDLTPLFGIIYRGKGFRSRTTGCRIAKDSANPVIELETRRQLYIWKTICRCYKSFPTLKSRRNAYRLFHSSVVARSTHELISYRPRTELNFLWVVRGVGHIRFEFPMPRKKHEVSLATRQVGLKVKRMTLNLPCSTDMIITTNR
jgi:hypothetical protein